MSYRPVTQPTEFYSFVVNIGAYPPEHRKCIEWLDDNCQGEYMTTVLLFERPIVNFKYCERRDYRFELQSDAALFKLFWSDSS